MKNFKTKFENFWYYHKWATILIIIFILSAVLLISTKTETAIYDGSVSVVTSEYLSSKQLSFDDMLEGKIEDVNNDGITSLGVNEYVISSETDSTSQANINQVISSFSTGETGFYIFDKANLERFMVYDAFRPLDHFIPKEKLAERREAIKDGTAYAINLSGLGIAEKYGLATDELYGAVIFDRPIEDTDEKTKKLSDNAITLLFEFLN